jgi:hypothetical protein
VKKLMGLFLLAMSVCASCAHTPAVIALLPSTGTAAARQGDILTLSAPLPNAQWQVVFDTERLELLTPADQLSAPGNIGWKWRARQPGTANIAIASVPSSGTQMRITISVEITKKK